MEENIWQITKKIIDLDECKKMKKESVIAQKYEHAAAFRDQEKFLMSDEGIKMVNRRKKKNHN